MRCDGTLMPETEIRLFTSEFRSSVSVRDSLVCLSQPADPYFGNTYRVSVLLATFPLYLALVLCMLAEVGWLGWVPSLLCTSLYTR